MNDNGLCFFASANSGRGFINFYGDVFADLKMHYIIKGGSGTGKSSLIKAVAAAAEEKGFIAERFYCSSDPDSLDGVIIPELSVGITDGTSPHIADPVYPGVKGEIIDLGGFWDKKILNDARESIVEMINNKNEIYSDVYSCLNAALSIDEIKERKIKSAICYNRIYTLINSCLKHIPCNVGKTRIRLTDAITIKGYQRVHPYLNTAVQIYDLKDSYGASHIFLNQLNKSLSGSEKTISYDAFNTEKINMIYLPQNKTLFTVNSDIGDEINIDELIPEKTSYLSNSSVINEAYRLLKNAGEIHFSLEKIYISAMDFEKKEEYQKKLIQEIFS